VIFGLTIQPIEASNPGDAKFHVEMDPSFGVEAVFDCTAVEIVDAVPMSAVDLEALPACESGFISL